MSGTEQAATKLPAWRVILAMIRFRPALWLANLGAMIVLMVFWQVPGLVMRAFFGALSSGARAGFNVWTLTAWMFAGEIVRLLGILGLIRTNVPFFVHTMTLLRRNLLRRILARPGAKALPDSPGEALSRFRGDVFEIPLFALWLNDLLGLVVFGAIALVVMCRINAGITAMAVLPFIAVGLAANAATSRVERYRRLSRRAAGIVSGFLGELFGAVQAVKVATAERDMVGRLRELNEERRRITLKDRLFNEILGSIFRNATNIGTGIILVLAGRAMQQRAFTVGDFALFVFYLDTISELTAFAGLLVARYHQIGVSVERMNRLMEGADPAALIEPAPIHLDGTPPEPPAVRLDAGGRLRELAARGLSYTFPGTGNGIRDVRLSLRRGTFTVITGRNGSGKTTLLRVLLGLLPRDGGEILWNGAAVDDPGAFFTPPRSAYTAQIPRLFSDTLRDNILLGFPAGDDGVAQAVYASVLDVDLARLEAGLLTRIGPKGVKLSGGQVQRAAAARMFVRGAELLVFDDLSSALDVETERILWERVFERQEATCLVVSHRKAALSRADHILVMKDGRVEAEGTLAELLASCEEMRRIWYGTDEEPAGMAAGELAGVPAPRI
ncbi:MAG: ATP-binding cassette domain-containing protein [Patescibacteria group bacterium]